MYEYMEELNLLGTCYQSRDCSSTDLNVEEVIGPAGDKIIQPEEDSIQPKEDSTQPEEDSIQPEVDSIKPKEDRINLKRTV